MKNSNEPIYKNIALDIANKIVRGELKPGERISGRSTLAGIYKVSPETIRRAIALLEEMKVVSANLGSGINILSISSAERFIEKNKNNEYVNTVKENIFEILEQKKKLDKELEENFNKISDFIERFNSISPFTLIEIDIKENSKVANKKVNEVKFWQYTGATIIAYRREKDIVVSPGPDYIFQPGDIIVVIGSSDVYDKVYSFLNY
ncbi:TrkA C-terminal domain-containing protein [Desnuesiella massiliensis]|uniref:TrkA C-terminal domain-containing protein n=1 Tax=Desnuesiella massiliensis TaxID=1650662 RepID=UPI0006E2B580|nr:TrkA C-terminal domain-containing protein [Desnuesiella massiliensis]